MVYCETYFFPENGLLLILATERISWESSKYFNKILSHGLPFVF